jgi:subtilisin family serine protease
MDYVYQLPNDLVVGPEWGYGLLSTPANWGVALMGVQRLRDVVKNPEIVVGVIDTGGDLRHPDLEGKIVEYANFSPENALDDDGHATHVAGTIAAKNPWIGVNPGAKIAAAKCLWGRPRPYGTTTSISQAIAWAGERAPIINGSIGSASADTRIRQAIVEAATGPRRVWYVGAAGNNGAQTPDSDYPARWPESAAIASLTEQLAVSTFSNRGAKIDGAAPGSNIWSCRPNGGYQSMSGTSMATPFVAGLLSLYRAGLIERGREIPTILDLREKLIRMARDVHTLGIDNRTGPGAIWPNLLAMDLEEDPKPVRP